MIGRCRFRDCKHDREPGCALLMALEDGRVQQQRMNSYRSIIASLPESSYWQSSKLPSMAMLWMLSPNNVVI